MLRIAEETAMAADTYDADHTESPPVVGIGATYSIGSDDYACTVWEVLQAGKVVIVTKDQVRGRGIYVPNPDGSRSTFSRRRDGRLWQAVRAIGHGASLWVGRRRHHMNPEF